MVTTRVVMALLAMVLLTGGAVALRTDRQVYASWALTSGFLAASIWGGLTYALATEGKAGMPTDAAISLTTMAVALAMYFLLKAVNREPVT